LPDAPGLELLRALRGRGLTIPFVVLTGSANAVDGFDAGRLGAGRFIQKPASPDQIADSLRQVATMELWDAVDEIHGLLRQWNLTDCESQVRVLHRTKLLLTDQRVSLVEFPFLAAVVREAAEDVSILHSALLKAASSIQSRRAQLDARLLELLRSVDESATAGRSTVLANLRRQSRHEIHELTGLRLSSWLRLARLRAAVQQLASSEEHVSQIAHGLGFKRPGQLTRDLHLLLGCSPRHLRRTLRAEFGNK
jgi:DNA-binding NarL/FixJ family response regulator